MCRAWLVIAPMPTGDFTNFCLSGGYEFQALLFLLSVNIMGYLVKERFWHGNCEVILLRNKPVMPFSHDCGEMFCVIRRG